MNQSEVPFDTGSDAPFEVPGTFIDLRIEGPVENRRQDWIVTIHWRWPDGGRVVVSGIGQDYDTAYLNAQRMLRVKALARDARLKLP